MENISSGLITSSTGVTSIGSQSINALPWKEPGEPLLGIFMPNANWSPLYDAMSSSSILPKKIGNSGLDTRKEVLQQMINHSASQIPDFNSKSNQEKADLISANLYNTSYKKFEQLHQVRESIYDKRCIALCVFVILIMIVVLFIVSPKWWVWLATLIIPVFVLGYFIADLTHLLPKQNANRWLDKWDEILPTGESPFIRLAELDKQAVQERSDYQRNEAIRSSYNNSGIVPGVAGIALGSLLSR